MSENLKTENKPVKIRLQTKRPQELGVFIRHRRKDLNLTQKVFAERVELTQNWVSQIETAGKVPDLSTIKRIMKGLGIRNFAVCKTKHSKHWQVFQIFSDELD